jgi:transketolase
MNVEACPQHLEISLCIDAHGALLAEGIRSRVVSMPSWGIFEHQAQKYPNNVLPSGVKTRVAVEQTSTLGWKRYIGRFGRVVGITTFGASVPLKELQRKFGFEPERVTQIAKELVGKARLAEASSGRCAWWAPPHSYCKGAQ